MNFLNEEEVLNLIFEHPRPALNYEEGCPRVRELLFTVFSLAVHMHVFVILGIETKALHILSKMLQSQPSSYFCSRIFISRG